MHWRGLPSHQIPADLLRLQNEIVKRRPSSIIEVGVGEGGTTRFCDDVCRLLDHGRLYTVDRVDEAGSSLPPNAMVHWGESLEVVRLLKPRAPTMVILDSNVYNARHCADELQAYAPLVSPGQMLVACHADRADWGMRPAVVNFLQAHSEFDLAVDGRDTLHAWLLRR